MSESYLKVDPTIQNLVDTKGFTFVITELKKWASNKEADCRARDKEDEAMYQAVQSALNIVLMEYK